MRILLNSSPADTFVVSIYIRPEHVKVGETENYPKLLV